MSSYTADRIDKPAHFRIAPLMRGRGKRKSVVIGFDSEQDTRTARPMLFQFSIAGDETDVTLRRIPAYRNGALDVFMTYVHDTCTRKDTEYLIVGWNLKYEFTQLFGELPDELNSLDDYRFVYRLEDASGNVIARYEIAVMNDKRYGVVLTNLATHRRVRLMDGAAFYTTSLDNAAKMLDLGRKVEMQSKRFTTDDLDNPLFLQYARQDAYLTRRIGEQIIDLHETFDVPTCITAPHFAARVFRRHFLRSEIPLPDPDLEQAGLSSYHGGKNGDYAASPRHFSNVYSYDITSAYPEAMRALPNPESAQFHWSDTYIPGVAALWRVSGHYRSCKYRGIMTHGNGFHETGDIADAWTTSYELDAAVERGEIDITDCAGYVMVGETGTGPLVEYVDRFFDMKRTATGAKRIAAKLFLNSLYGKFFQKVALGIVGYYDAETLDETGSVRYIETDPLQPFDYQAGGLYHPPIASLITGYVRAKIHRLEHKYGALMTSTDGFFARRKPDPADIGTDLGMLTVERGDLSIWRERLYEFTPRNETSKPKFALHGFRGSIAELRRIPLKPGAYAYTAQQVITNKLALKTYRGERFRPGTFAILQFTLDLTQSQAPP
jgi:hypothetical protein